MTNWNKSKRDDNPREEERYSETESSCFISQWRVGFFWQGVNWYVKWFKDWKIEIYENVHLWVIGMFNIPRRRKLGFTIIGMIRTLFTVLSTTTLWARSTQNPNCWTGSLALLLSLVCSLACSLRSLESGWLDGYIFRVFLCFGP